MVLTDSTMVTATSSGSGLAWSIIGVVGTVVGTVASIIGVLLAIAWSPRRSNEVPVIDKKVPTVRFWRPRNYNLALGHLQAFAKRWQDHLYETNNRRGCVTEYDLIRWIIQLALTCAANIVPQSLGKASLFRVSQIEQDSQGRVTRVSIYSSEFDGIFSGDQLIEPLQPKRIRDISIVTQGERHGNYPAALQCVASQRPIIQSLRRRSADFDAPERNLGLTHVLAIPLRRDFSDVISDQPVSITVDLHYFWPVGYLLDHMGLHNKTLLRRANQIYDILSRVTAIHSNDFLPPSDLKSPSTEPSALSETIPPPKGDTHRDQEGAPDNPDNPPGQFW